MISKCWPGGARCAVFMSFDFDAETLWLDRDPSNIRRPGTLSQGTYGVREGVPRLLRLLKEEGLRSTFFIPGWVIDNRRPAAEAIVAAGHEIGHHGYLHRSVSPDDPEGEEEEFLGGLDAIRRLTGASPLGYRAPSGETTPRLVRMLAENGFVYDSSMLDGIMPYRHRVKGTDLSLIELPWHWSLDDVPYLLTSGTLHRSIFTNDHILQIWKAEFDAIYAEGGLFTIVMHPQVIGRPSRIVLLRELIAHIRRHDDVWFGTGREVATAWDAAKIDTSATDWISPFLEQ